MYVYIPHSLDPAVDGHWKTVWKFLKKLKIELLCELAIPFLGMYPEKMKTLDLKSYSPVFITVSPHPHTHLSSVHFHSKRSKRMHHFFFKPIQEACGILVPK